MRGEDPIVAAFFETQRAANRNGHKEHWRSPEVPLYRLVLKLGEEVLELISALVRGDSEHVRAELGDVLWVLIMIVDRKGHLEC